MYMYYAQSRLSVIKHGVSTKQGPQINRECAALNPSSDGGSGDELQGWLPVHLTDGPTDGWLKGEQKETEEQPKHPRHRRKLDRAHPILGRALHHSWAAVVRPHLTSTMPGQAKDLGNRCSNREIHGRRRFMPGKVSPARRISSSAWTVYEIADLNGSPARPPVLHPSTTWQQPTWSKQQALLFLCVHGATLSLQVTLLFFRSLYPSPPPWNNFVKSSHGMLPI